MDLDICKFIGLDGSICFFVVCVFSSFVFIEERRELKFIIM